MANTAEPRAAANAASLAQPGRALDPVQRRIEIEIALGMALHLVRQPHVRDDITTKNLQAATARTNRALTMLKVACNEAINGGLA